MSEKDQAKPTEEKTITSMMAEKRVFSPPKELSEKAYIKSFAEYKKIYEKSVKNTRMPSGQKWPNSLTGLRNGTKFPFPTSPKANTNGSSAGN